VLATLLSATLVALDGRVIRVEVDVAPGLPGFTIVGLGDASIREARERVRGALRNSGLSTRRGGSRSTLRRPICRRPAPRRTSPSRSGS
jgi:magnesium chelatase family protein